MNIRVAIVGTGAMGRGIVQVLSKIRDMEVVAIADINPDALEKTKPYLSKDALVTTNPLKVLNADIDVFVDATPSIVEAAILIKEALRRKIHVVLMNSEVDQVYGRLLAKEAESNGVVITSDAGDQHGVLLRQIKEIKSMGLEVVMAANNKGFLDRYATPISIEKEAEKRRLTLNQCTAYTDGTKLSIEMALVANALNLDLLKTGMVGPRADHVNDALKLFDLEKARKLGGVVDYLLGAKPGGSVFSVAYSDEPDDRFYMNYYKMGEGPYYVFLRPYHLCHFETPWAIRGIMERNEPVLVQNKRVLEVCAFAKKDLERGTILDGIGGFHIYGVLTKPGNLPIGLSEGVILTKRKKKDEPIEWDDVEFEKDDKKLKLWEEQKN